MTKVLTSTSKFSQLQKIRVGVVCGGTSAERNISIRSGRGVLKALVESGIQAERLDPATKTFWKKTENFDILFLVLHGNGGEDGSIQAILERRGIPFTGSGSKACRKSFNKLVTKRYLRKWGIPTPTYTVLSQKHWKKRATLFPTPYFVKPLDGGSSQGVFPVEDFKKSAETIRKSLARHQRLLIEKRIYGRELTCGILAGRALPVVEVRPRRSFYDYKAKYTRGMTEYLVPAPILHRVASKVMKLTEKVCGAMELKDFARVDFMLDEQNKPYVLEVNSIPGMTELSLLPKAARAAGISYHEVCLTILAKSLKRFRGR